MKHLLWSLCACFCLISCVESEETQIVNHIKSNIGDPKSFELISIYCMSNPSYQEAIDSAIVEYKTDLKRFNPKYKNDRWNIERCNRYITFLDSLKQAHPELMDIQSKAKLYSVQYRANNIYGGKERYSGLYRINGDGYVHGDSYDESFRYSLWIGPSISLTRDWALKEIPEYNEFIDRENVLEEKHKSENIPIGSL